MSGIGLGAFNIVVESSFARCDMHSLNASFLHLQFASNSRCHVWTRCHAAETKNMCKVHGPGMCQEKVARIENSGHSRFAHANLRTNLSNALVNAKIDQFSRVSAQMKAASERNRMV